MYRRRMIQWRGLGEVGVEWRRPAARKWSEAHAVLEQRRAASTEEGGDRTTARREVAAIDVLRTIVVRVMSGIVRH
jgi:hypothetical protein